MKNSTKFIIWSSGFLLALFLTLIPSVAQANAGVPMIFLVFPPLTISLVPIIIVEAVVYALSGVANFILFPVWLEPAPNEQLLYLVPLSSFLFLVIAYFISVFVEKLLMRWLLEEVWHKPIERSRLQKSVIYANLATYIPLAIFIPLLLYLRGLQYVS